MSYRRESFAVKSGNRPQNCGNSAENRLIGNTEALWGRAENMFALRTHPWVLGSLPLKRELSGAEMRKSLVRQDLASDRCRATRVSRFI